MKFSYRKTSNGYLCDELNIHGLTMIELRDRVAKVLVLRSAKNYQEIYDELEFV